MKRAEILETAKNYVCGDREQDYGSPKRSFETIADLWTVYLVARGKLTEYISSKDAAVMLALLKISRITTGQAKADNWVDLAGYAACGGEIETEAEA